MKNLEKFFVAGHRGMVGSAILRQLQSTPCRSGAPAANASGFRWSGAPAANAAEPVNHIPHQVLVQTVKRNLTRFPQDFIFQPSADELTALTSRTVTSNTGRGGRRTSPYVFTEQGVSLLPSVLSSPEACWNGAPAANAAGFRWSGAPAANASTSPMCWVFVAAPAALAVVFAQNTPLLIVSLLALVFAYSAVYARLSQFRWCFSAATMLPKPVINAI